MYIYMVAEVASYSSLHCKFCGKRKYLCQCLGYVVYVQCLAQGEHTLLGLQYMCNCYNITLYYLFYILCMILAKTCLTITDDLQIHLTESRSISADIVLGGGLEFGDSQQAWYDKL